MNGENRGGWRYWADRLFFMLPFLASAYIAMVLVPAAGKYWPARFVSWQELWLLVLVVVLALVCVRPSVRLIHGQGRQGPGVTGVTGTLSTLALTGGAVALLLNLSPWIVGSFLVAAALPPAVRSLTGPGKDVIDRRFDT